MSFGVHIIPGKGVIENFTTFTSEDLLEKTKTYLENDSVGIPHSISASYVYPNS